MEEKLAFRLLCDEFDKRLPFEEKSRLEHESIAQRLHFVSDGNIGRLKQFIFDAACLAINDNATTIEQKYFTEAYERRKPPGQAYNPFQHHPSMAPTKSASTRVDMNMSRNDVFSKKRKANDSVIVR